MNDHFSESLLDELMLFMPCILLQLMLITPCIFLQLTLITPYRLLQLMLITLCIFVQLTLNIEHTHVMQFMTSIELANVSVLGCRNKLRV